MPSFINTPFFPYTISAWAVGGRGYKTTVVETYGGDEYRNAAWAQARGEWDVSEALRSTNSASAYNWIALRNMHRVCRGMLYGFRFRDYTDYTDEGGGTITMIDATHYQLYKTYTISPLSDTQIIQKPEPTNAWSPGYAGVVIAGGGTYALDYDTGIITVSAGAAPTSWTGQFHVPCRFNSDIPRMGLDGTGAFFNWESLRVVEIRNPG